ncbi:MAG TPA: hypothetical protein VGM27_28285, partial [Acidobacteriaceae bacterium]
PCGRHRRSYARGAVSDTGDGELVRVCATRPGANWNKSNSFSATFLSKPPSATSGANCASAMALTRQTVPDELATDSGVHIHQGHWL